MSGKNRPIKKLRIRIFIVIMAVLIVILSGVAVGILSFMSNSELKQTDALLDNAMDFEFNFKTLDKNSDENFGEILDENFNEDPDSRKNENQTGQSDNSDKIDIPGFDFKNDSDSLKMNRGFFFESVSPADSSWIFICMEDGECVVSFSNRFAQGESKLDFTDAYDEIVMINEERGFVLCGGIKFRYLYQSDSGNAVLINYQMRTQTIQRLLAIIAVIGLCALAILVPIVILLTIWITNPIKESWKKQKEFFADASHELKTPLTVISANVDVIMSNPDDTVLNQNRWFLYIKSECNKMYGLITEMLYLSREDMTVSEGKKRLSSESFDFSEAVQGVCLAFEALAFEKGKNFETQIDEKVNCKGNKEEITRLVNILIDNGIKHSDENGRVNVSLKKIKNKAVLSVSNTGKQIPKEELQRVFDRFYRTDKSRTNETGGFGLGLAIAKTIAEKNGGNLTVTSDIDGITTFVFKL